MATKKTPAPKRAGNAYDRNEWLALMTELANTDRDAYRAFREEIWALIASRHLLKDDEQMGAWRSLAN